MENSTGKQVGESEHSLDVINMGTHVFECEWVKRDSDLNRFLAMCSCLPQWFDDLSDVIYNFALWVEATCRGTTSQQGASRRARAGVGQ